ncbi:hypothetical protein BK004_04890 [bacterium CG10_46_32]|nr:MAG: hypothetical protein BK004_04890 [bacterium CG10_46_32]PIR55651.1 MAG: hypothetical protein COU73_04940 [Parcubacteria group bacterium CG10_big_fil_rev_8_21_14_0_10_46_32]
MDERQKELLRHIVESHVKTAQPVGSAFIAEHFLTDVSGPTVRNWMQELEREGLITHPHTSAGRIPTEAGYRFYIQRLLLKKTVSQKHQQAFFNVSDGSSENAVKAIAKKSAELSGEAVVVGFSPNNVYYTGLSNILSKPEFTNHDSVVTISGIIDHLDEVMSDIGSRLDEDISVLLGSDNPFGSECGSVLTIVSNGMVIGMLGPMRMDYGANIAFLKHIKTLLL